jgi:hypothetical protein
MHKSQFDRATNGRRGTELESNTMSIRCKAIISVGVMVCIGSSTVAGMEAAVPDRKPNILYIMADDHAVSAISAYKGFLAKVAPTPNIDRLAHEGMLFERVFVGNSISGSPSMASPHGREVGFVYWATPSVRKATSASCWLSRSLSVAG